MKSPQDPSPAEDAAAAPAPSVAAPAGSQTLPHCGVVAVVGRTNSINGVAYVGDTRMSHDARRGWYEDSLYGFHRGETFDDGMTAAARRVMLPILQRLATELATPERIKAARIESATHALERAREALNVATVEFEQARAHLAEVSR